MTPNYGLGLLRYNGGDPLQRTSWEKDGRKYLSQANGNYGTGHNSFFMSPDGTQVWVSRHRKLDVTTWSVFFFFGYLFC